MAVVVGAVVAGAAGCASSDRSGEAAVRETEAEITRALGLDETRPRVLLLGTFHFADAGLDAYKPKHSIDVGSAERQAEIEDVVERLASFEPTLVCVERKPEFQAQLDERYRAYLAGEYELPDNELYQIGFRLAKRAGLDGVVAVDAEGRWLEPRVDPAAYAAEHGQTDLLRSEVMRGYLSLAQWGDESKTRRTIRETLLSMNSPMVLRAAAGVYFVGSYRVGEAGDYPGVDGFMTAWFNRNMRIYMNIVRAIDQRDERAVVLFGQGHVPQLRYAVESSPEVELVEVSEVLGE